MSNIYPWNPYVCRDNGLRGEGQIIGFADTGLDVDHCYFRDTSAPVKYITPSDMLDKTKNTLDSKHRKIAGYVSFADSFEESEGHGTHVAGSLSGAAPFTNSASSSHEGMAPSAKLAFMVYE